MTGTGLNSRISLAWWIGALALFALCLPVQAQSGTRDTSSRTGSLTAAGSKRLTCENGDNEEAGCCCFNGSHTYSFELALVAEVDVVVDTGRGYGCSSQVAVEVLANGSWETLDTVAAVSSGSSGQVNPISKQLTVGRVISGVRLGDGCACCIDGSEVTLKGLGPATPVPGGPEEFTAEISHCEWARGVCVPPPNRDTYEPVPAQLRFVYDLLTGSPDRIESVQWWIDGRWAGTTEPNTSADQKERYVHTVVGSGRLEVELRLELVDGTSVVAARKIVKLVDSAIPDPPIETCRISGPVACKPPETLTFNHDCPAGSLWYLDGRWMTNAPEYTWLFEENRIYELAVRGEHSDLAIHYVDCAGGHGLEAKWRNRFRDNGQRESLEICAQHWESVRQGNTNVWASRWSDCRDFRTIAPVDGWALCTGVQADGYNTGWLVHAPRDQNELKFEVFAFDFEKRRGRLVYDGRLDLTRRQIVPEKLSFVECKSRAATVQWRNDDDSVCKARIWKTPPGRSSSNVFVDQGVEDLGCVSGFETLRLWGRQIAGTGHASNARLETPELELALPATITDVETNAPGFCIWTVFRPGRQGRAVQCWEKGQPSLVGTVLQPDTYAVVPAVEGPSDVTPTGWIRLSRAEVTVLLVVGGAPNVNPIVNPSFELGTPAGPFRTIGSGSGELPGWTVTQETIDLVGDYFEASDGSQSVDLYGSPGVGAISQTFATVPGRPYRLTFDLAGNPGAGARVMRLLVRVADESRTFEFDTNGRTLQQMGWRTETIDFAATSDLTLLEFISQVTDTDSPLAGPAIDNVVVTPR